VPRPRLTALAIMQLLPGGAHASSGLIMFDGIDLLRLGWRAINSGGAATSR